MIENARCNPASDIDPTPCTISKRHISCESPEHLAKHIERRARDRTSSLQRGSSDLGCAAQRHINLIDCRYGAIEIFKAGP